MDGASNSPVHQRLPTFPLRTVSAVPLHVCLSLLARTRGNPIFTIPNTFATVETESDTKCCGSNTSLRKAVD